MKGLLKIGRLLYGIGIVAVGVHQIIIKDFRPEILPPFPQWAHQYVLFPILIGIALVFAGISIAFFSAKKTCIYLGFFFLILIVTCHLPYVLFLSPVGPTHLAVWFGPGEAMAYSGGAFVMAGSFSGRPLAVGRIFFSVLMIIFGCSHYVFADDVSKMVPKWAGSPMFWTYFVGVALIASGIAIIFKIWIKTVALLLAGMLFLFFIFFHVPDAMNNPSEGHGNEIVRAFLALIFCGIALVIALTNSPERQTIRQFAR
ncbi:MAG: hypothetical protein C5B59_19535 [Bacteroidetes bacterium]|nr:MAG: hypothetical protein C5B59_19535 [Bacteroidota bacterium]